MIFCALLATANINPGTRKHVKSASSKSNARSRKRHSVLLRNKSRPASLREQRKRNVGRLQRKTRPKRRLALPLSVPRLRLLGRGSVSSEPSLRQAAMRTAAMMMSRRTSRPTSRRRPLAWSCQDRPLARPLLHHLFPRRRRQALQRSRVL